MVKFLEHRFLVFWLVVVSLIGFGLPINALSHDHGNVRIYKLNKKGQALKQRWAKDTEIEGCHSSKKQKEAFRFAQAGYAYCTIYAEQDCESGSEIGAKWGKKKYRSADFDIDEPQIKLLKGDSWMISEEENTLIRSWFCSYE